MAHKTPSQAQELDVRNIVRARRHHKIFAAYSALQPGETLVLINDHAPHGLLQEFEQELAGSFDWEPLQGQESEHRVRITKLASTALPRVVGDTNELPVRDAASGSVWQLEPGARDLDANIIVLPAHGEIALHVGPALDVLLVVLQGSGELSTELGTTVALQQGTMVWLPRHSQRRFVAGANGIQYFSVHQRKPTLNITANPTPRV